MVTKIIHIKPHLPPYECAEYGWAPCAKFSTQNGNWAGIWKHEREQAFCEALLKQSDEFSYEIWQPDLRADKIYGHCFENGVTQRILPAHTDGQMVAQRLDVRSECMLDELRRCSKESSVIAHLYGYMFGVNRYILMEEWERMPLIFSFRGEIWLPKEHLWDKKYINRISYITYMSDTKVRELKKIFRGKMTKHTMGCDFSFFKKLDKRQCRQELGLPQDTFIFIGLGFYYIKQIKEFIKVLLRLDNKYDFIYILVGDIRTPSEYVDEVKKMAEPLCNKGKVIFTGRLKNKGPELIKYLNSADLFVCTSISEGGPIAAMEASACELPIFSTATGRVAEVLKQYRAGCLVGVKNYEQWQYELEKILNGRKIKILERKIAEIYFDWNSIARRFLRIYKYCAQPGFSLSRLRSACRNLVCGRS